MTAQLAADGVAQGTPVPRPWITLTSRRPATAASSTERSGGLARLVRRAGPRTSTSSGASTGAGRPDG